MTYIEINELLKKIKDSPINEILDIIETNKNDGLFLAMTYLFCKESSVLLHIADDRIENTLAEKLIALNNTYINSNNHYLQKKILLSKSFDANEITSSILYLNNIFYDLTLDDENGNKTFSPINHQTDTVKIKDRIITLKNIDGHIRGMDTLHSDKHLYTCVINLNKNNLNLIDSIVDISYFNQENIPYRARFYNVMSNDIIDLEYIKLLKNKVNDLEHVTNEFLYATFNDYINKGKVSNLDALANLLDVDKKKLDTTIHSLLGIYGNIQLTQIPQLIEILKDSLAEKNTKDIFIPEIDYVSIL